MSQRRNSGRIKNKKKVNYLKMSGSNSAQHSSSTTSEQSPASPTEPTHACPAQTFTCESCGQLQATLNKLIDKVTQLEKQLAEQSMQIATQSAQLATQTQQIAANQNDVQPATIHFDQDKLEERLNEIEERIEERTNRQMRKTLVFRGVREHAGEKYWKHTDERLSKVIADAITCSESDASDMIDRCHRTGNPQYYKDAGRSRPIAAAMHSWKDCEDIIDTFRKNNSGVYVDYKYGPMTTKRRNLALQLRKELKQKGEIDQAFISYPAKLKGRKRGEREYKVIKDFSKHAV